MITHTPSRETLQIWLQRADEHLLYEPDGMADDGTSIHQYLEWDFMAREERPAHVLSGFLRTWSNVYADPWYWGWDSSMPSKVVDIGVEIMQALNKH